jgi:hypothetical protein
MTKHPLLMSFAVLLFACGNSPETPTESVEKDASAQTLLAGSFVAKAHPGTGGAVIEQATTGELRLLFDAKFKTDNGPKLSVYLSKASSSGSSGHLEDALVLGRLKSASGEQAYGIAAGTDLSLYRSAIVWCDDFSVLFTIADLKN